MILSLVFSLLVVFLSWVKAVDAPFHRHKVRNKSNFPFIPLAPAKSTLYTSCTATTHSWHSLETILELLSNSLDIFSFASVGNMWYIKNMKKKPHIQIQYIETSETVNFPSNVWCSIYSHGSQTITVLGMLMHRSPKTSLVLGNVT